mgnify:CR=1 FL=1
MQIVLLSGGSGKRLWPLSNDVRSKQFLKILKNDSGDTESMVQRVYRQLCDAGLGKNVSIATGVSQVGSIKNQLGSRVSVIVEPQRRNTFPAIALSAAYLCFEKKCSDDETVIVLPVDPYVSQSYFDNLHRLDEAVQNNIADIVLMGVTPTSPSEKFGYIIPMKTDGDSIYKVSCFKEKPKSSEASELIKMGGLWNCGVFAFRLSYIMNIVNDVVKCSSFGDVSAQYSAFEKTSFDYAVVEKAKSVGVLPYNGSWNDLGTWNALSEVMDGFTIGDVQMDESCNNCHVINEMDIPVLTMGAKDMIVVACPDGILVADKEKSAHIKKLVECREARPMFEERSYGHYTVLRTITDENGITTVTKMKHIIAGRKIMSETHSDHDEVWTVVGGKVCVRIDDTQFEASAGDTFKIPAGSVHGIDAKTDADILEVQINRG